MSDEARQIPPQGPYSDATAIYFDTASSDCGLPNKLHVQHVDSNAGARDESNKRRKLGLPRILKNDIRRHYCKMFLNTINSADVFHMQDFFNTFMVGHCSCVVDQKFAPEFLLPERLSALGPRLAAHYVLGVFLMFPDLVLTLVNSQIITNSACSGSKIHLQVQVSFTKVCHIPMGQWLPSPRSAQPVNNEHSATSVARTADLIQLGSDSSLSAAVEQKGSIFATPGQDQPIFEQCVPSKSSSDNDSCGEKKNQLCNTMQDSYPAEGMYRLQVAQPYIPYSYIRNLSNEAAPLQNPLPSKSAGTITFYLDSNNHIQHMSMNLLSL